MCSFENAGSEISTMSMDSPEVVSLGDTFKVLLATDRKGETLFLRTSPHSIDGTIPVSKGGTGLSELEGGRLIASSANGHFFEEIDVPISTFSGLTGNIQKQLDQSKRFDVTVPFAYSSKWTTYKDGSQTKYKLTINVAGISVNDNPIVTLTRSSDSSLATKEQDAFGEIECVETGNNKIIVYATTLPSTSIKIALTRV